MRRLEDNVSSVADEGNATSQARLFTLGLNETVCVELDGRLQQMVEMRDRAMAHVEDPTSIVVPVLILCMSLVTLCFGARLFRFAAAFAAGGFAFYGVYTFGRTTGERVSCDALIIISSVMAAVAAICAGCIYKAGLFFVGAAAMAFLVHLVYSAFPDLHTMGDQPMLAQKSLAYWGLMLLAGVGGGLVLRWHSKPVLEVITSCVGGAGVSYALYAIADIAEADVDGWVFMVSGLAAALVGVVAQRQLRLRGCKRRNADAQDVPRMG